MGMQKRITNVQASFSLFDLHPREHHLPGDQDKGTMMYRVLPLD